MVENEKKDPVITEIYKKGKGENGRAMYMKKIDQLLSINADASKQIVLNLMSFQNNAVFRKFFFFGLNQYKILFFYSRPLCINDTLFNKHLSILYNI